MYFLNKTFINPFQGIFLFLYPLKTSINYRIFDIFRIFRRYRNGKLAEMDWPISYPWSLSIPPENIKKIWFSDVFRGYRKRPVA